MVQFETTEEEPEMENDENEIPRVSYHNMSLFLSNNLRKKPDVTVANSHQTQHQLPPVTTSQSTINPMSIFTIRKNRLNSMNTTQQILICKDQVLKDPGGFYNTDEIILSKLYVRFAGDQGKT